MIDLREDINPNFLFNVYENCLLKNTQQTKMDWNELKILIHFNSIEQNMDWKNSIYINSILYHGLKWIVWSE